MSLMPYINGNQQSVDYLTQFGGLNRNISISDGEFSDMQNMSVDKFPLASTRGKRGELEFEKGSTILSAVGKDKLLVAYTRDSSIEFTEAIQQANLPEDCYRKDNETYYTSVKAIINEPKPYWRYGFEPHKNHLIIGYRYYSPDQIDIKEETSENGNSIIINVKYPHGDITDDGGYVWTKLCSSRSHEATEPESYNEFSVTAEFCERPFNNFNLESLIGFTIKSASHEIYPIDRYYVYGDSATIESIDTEFLPYINKVRYTFHLSEYISNVYDNIFIKIADGIDKSYLSRSMSDVTVRKPVITDGLFLKEIANTSNEWTYTDEYGNKNNVILNIGDVEYDESVSHINLMKPTPYFPATTINNGQALWLGEYSPEEQKLINKTTVYAVASEQEHTVVEMGANVVIFPEKIKINTAEVDEYGHFNDVKPLEIVDKVAVDYVMVDHNGTAIVSDRNKFTAGDEPSNPTKGWIWLDTKGNKPPLIKKYIETTGTWSTMQGYCRLFGVSEEWKEGDAFSLEYEYSDIKENTLQFAKDQKYCVIYRTGKTYDGRCWIDFPCSFSGSNYTRTSDEHYTLKRTVPDMDYIVECNNRLWGCKYGKNEDGEFINEIFASKLGDPCNWHCFNNTAMDSYYVSLGDDGAFTGATVYQSNPVFFRSDTVHRIYGNYPANYQLKTIKCAGVSPGSHRSVIVLNDVVYYLSQDGVFAFNGATPTKISENFAFHRYKNGISGIYDHNLYMTLYDAKDGKPNVFVYNDYYGTWHKQDDLNIIYYMNYDGECYGLTEDHNLITINGKYGTPEADFKWFFSTGNIGYTTPYRKFINKVVLRLKMDLTSRCSSYIQYDSDGNWIRIAEIIPTGKMGSIALPIIPHRCDHFAIKLEGKGDIELLSMSKFTEEGNEYA